MLDLIVRGGMLVDGTGTSAARADVAIADGRIVDVGRLDGAEAEHVLDAGGRMVAPGFVDIHSHSDFTLLAEPTAKSALYQGVTSELVGNCGHGCAPITEPSLFTANIYGYVPSVPVAWRTMGGYLDALQQAQPAVNVASLVANGNLRLAVLGLADRPATPDETRAMQMLLESALDDGAWGYSTGLEYAAERACTEPEMAALCQVVAGRGGLYATHTRNREARAVESVEEAVRVAAASEVRLQVSHIVPRHGGPPDALERSIDVVERAHASGMDIAFDAHTRLFGITNLMVALPPWALEGGPSAIAARMADPTTRAEMKAYRSLISSFGLGGWQHVFVLDAPASPEARDRSIADLAMRGRDKDAYEVIYDILLAHADELHRPMCICWSYDEDQLAHAFKHPLCMVGSDATTLSPDGPYGQTSFHGAYTWASWYFRRMVRERHLLSPEEAIRRLSAIPAERIGLPDRGLVARGKYADLVVLDTEAFTENGTVEEPNRLASGVVHVVVNGRIALEDGQATGVRAGHVLRR